MNVLRALINHSIPFAVIESQNSLFGSQLFIVVSRHDLRTANVKLPNCQLSDYSVQIKEVELSSADRLVFRRMLAGGEFKRIDLESKTYAYEFTTLPFRDYFTNCIKKQPIYEKANHLSSVE